MTAAAANDDGADTDVDADADEQMSRWAEADADKDMSRWADQQMTWCWCYDTQ